MGGKLSKRKKGYNVSDPKEQREDAPGRLNQKQNLEDASTSFKMMPESEASGTSSTMADAATAEKAAAQADRTPPDTNPSEMASAEASPKEVKEAPVGGEGAPRTGTEEAAAAGASAATELSSQAVEPGPEVSCTAEKEVSAEPQQSSESAPPESQDVQSRPETGQGSVTSPRDVTIKESKDSENEIIAKATEKKSSYTESAAQDLGPGDDIQVQTDSAGLAQPGVSSTAINLIPKLDLESPKDPTTLAGAPEISLGECRSSVLDYPSEISVVAKDVSEHHKPCAPELENTPPGLIDTEVTVHSNVSEVVEAEGNPVPEEVEKIEQAPIFQASPTLDKAEDHSESIKEIETEATLTANGIPQTDVSESCSKSDTLVDEKMEETGTLEDVVNSPMGGTSEAGENHLYDRTEVDSTEAIITAGHDEDTALGEKATQENGECETEDIRCSTPELSTPCLDQDDKPAADEPSKMQQERVSGINKSPENPKEAKDGEFLQEAPENPHVSQAVELV